MTGACGSSKSLLLAGSTRLDSATRVISNEFVSISYAHNVDCKWLASGLDTLRGSHPDELLDIRVVM
jgi:hypothetical protein